MTEAELRHYGVVGMKWGKRKTQPPSTIDIKKAQKKAESAERKAINRKQKKDKAFDESFKDYWDSEVENYIKTNNRMYKYTSEANKINDKIEYGKALEKYTKSEAKYQEAKNAYVDARRIARSSIKDVKELYKQELIAGQSFTEYVIGNISGSNNRYATKMYNQNKTM